MGPISRVLEDRIVVREGMSIWLNCSHKLKNINRIRWDFKPSESDTLRTLYDSKDNIYDETAIKVFCRHDLFHCNIALVDTKIEDTGKYICSIGENNVNQLNVFTEMELVIRGSKKESMIVSIGESTILPCRHNIANVTRIKWDHISIDNKKTEYSYPVSLLRSSQNNYEVLCGPHQPCWDIKLLKITKESAGKYICRHGDSHEYEEKYGFYEMTDFIEVELIVGKITCNANGNDDITLIGENDCHGINPDVLNLECSFSYYGNIDVDGQDLEWVGTHSQYEITYFQEIKKEPKTISIQGNLSVVNGMMGKTFQCILNNTKVEPCHLNKLNIQYAKNTTGKPLSIYSDDLRNIRCQADKSESVKCSYYWMHTVAGATLKTPHELLPAENMNLPGIYTCIAKCSIKEDLGECNIKAMEIDVIHVRSPSVAGFIVTIIIILLVCLITSCILYRIYLRKKYRNIMSSNKYLESETKEFIKIRESPTMLDKNVQCNSEEIRYEPIRPAFTFNDTKELGQNVISIIINEDVFVCRLNNSKVSVFALDRNDNNITPGLELKDLIGVETINNRFYILGLVQKRTGDRIMILKINNVSGSRDIQEIYKRPYIKNSFILLTKSHCGNNLVIIFRDELRFLSTDGVELKKIELPLLISNAYHLSTGRFIVCSIRDRNLRIVGGSGAEIAKYFPTEGMPDIESSLITTISSDAFGNVYLNNKETIFVLSDSLKFLCSHDIGEEVKKIAFDEEKIKLFVLTASGRLLTYTVY